jgi:pimeloyl-ACP methyl ester carboxylesterase
MMSHRMFEPQVGALSDEFRVITFDHRARTVRWQGPYDLYQLADDCRLLLDQLDVQRCVLAGMSMGGFMALRFALRWPHRLDGLILIGTSATPYSEQDRQTWREHYKLLCGLPAVPATFAEAEARICFSPETRRTNPKLVQHWVDRWTTYTGDAVYAEVESWLDQDDILERLGQIDLPVLVLHGERDEAVPLADAVALADRLPDARLTSVADAGHTVNLEAPQASNQAIRQFLHDIYRQPPKHRVLGGREL